MEGCRGGRSESEGREGGEMGEVGVGWGGVGWGGRAAAYTWQQLSALDLISQTIKDDFRLPLKEIIIL